MQLKNLLVEFVRKNTKIFFILVLPVYFYIIQSSILNKHTHFFHNGLVVTHSHPFNMESDDPVNNHGHSQKEIYLFSVLNIDLHNSIIEYVIDFIAINNPETFIVADVRSEYYSPHFQIAPRGPPFRI